MDDTPSLVINHLELAKKIAAKYFNIRGMTREEVLSEANLALIRAAKSFDPTKGVFAPYAYIVIKNTLNSLFVKQVKSGQMFPKSIDETIIGSAQMDTSIGNMAQNHPDSRQNVVKAVRSRETERRLKIIVAKLSPKERVIIDCLRKGMSLSDIGKKLGVSKQAVFKTAKPTMNKIKEILKSQGYYGVDEDGLLKTDIKK